MIYPIKQRTVLTRQFFVLYVSNSSRQSNEKVAPLELFSKGQFFKNTAYLERGMPYFAFVSANAVLVKKIDNIIPALS